MAAAAVCTLTKEMTEGPYYLDGQYVRADITEGKTGFPLKLALTVVDDDTCATHQQRPRRDLALRRARRVLRLRRQQRPQRARQRHLPARRRAHRLRRRRPHHHGLPGLVPGPLRPHPRQGARGVTLTADGSFTGGTELHTGQLFFDETVTAKVGALSPYSANTVTRTTLAQDSIYDDGGAASGLLTLTALGSSPSAGYSGTLTLGVER